VVAGRPVTFRSALLATGSVPARPDVPGLAGADPLTSETVWDLAELPGRLLVLGGGATGCELGQAYARLGSAVTVVEPRDRLLAAEDPEASALVTAALVADGVTVRTGTTLDRVGPGTAVLGTGEQVDFDRILVAAGRRAVTDCDPAAAGIELDPDGTVRVDATLRTTGRQVWAAGDLTGHPRYTHVAGVHGSIAATNAVLGLRRTVRPTVPRVTFTSPEVASVGLTGADAAGTAGLTARTVRHGHLDRAVAEGRIEGFSRIWVDGRGRVVGGTLVGPRAGEVLAELTLAVTRGLRTRDLAGSMHAYPTYADGLWNAAIADVRARLAAPVAARAARAVLAARRHWPRR
jgi:pyruvate/2-oxoglutarate dehydrogenase complex dihydrolipoamide dehydrogenase (E3) component